MKKINNKQNRRLIISISFGILFGIILSYFIFFSSINGDVSSEQEQNNQTKVVRFEVELGDSGGDINDCRDYLTSHYENPADWQHLEIHECFLYSIKKIYNNDNFVWKADCNCQYS